MCAFHQRGLPSGTNGRRLCQINSSCVIANSRGWHTSSVAQTHIRPLGQNGLNCVAWLSMPYATAAAPTAPRPRRTRWPQTAYLAQKRGGLGSGLLLSRLEPTDSNSEGGWARHGQSLNTCSPHDPPFFMGEKAGNRSLGDALDDLRPRGYPAPSLDKRAWRRAAAHARGICRSVDATARAAATQCASSAPHRSASGSEAASPSACHTILTHANEAFGRWRRHKT